MGSQTPWGQSHPVTWAWEEPQDSGIGGAHSTWMLLVLKNSQQPCELPWRMCRTVMTPLPSPYLEHLGV